MITLEGYYADDVVVWVTWIPEKGTNINYPGISNYVANTVVVSPVTPTVMKLPPLGPASLMYVVEGSDYGGRLVTWECGSLVGSTSPSREPLPCQHSTLTGTVLNVGSPGNRKPPVFRRQFDSNPGSKVWYRSDGARLSWLTGCPTASYDRFSYDQNGVLVPIVPRSDNYLMWLTYSHLYSDWIPADYPSPTRPYVGVKHGEYWWSSPPNAGATTAFNGTRHTWTHVSANSWIEEWIQEYHTSASYIRHEPISPSGYGYERAFQKRTRKHTLYAIQQHHPGEFRGQFVVEEEVSWKGQIPTGFNPEAVSGKKKDTYSYFAQITVMAPGLTSDIPMGIWNGLDAYCALAAERSKLLFSEKLMTTARSNAVADVTGLESNWIENLSQAKGTLDVVNPLIDGYKAVINRDMMAAKRALAGAYLVYMYSVRPTIADSQDLDNNLGTTVKHFVKNRFSNERRRGAAHSSCTIHNGMVADLNYYCTLHFTLKDNSFSAVWNALESLGLDPSIGNLWDLVPYGFVVDWFLKIGPALTKISAYTSSVLTRNLSSRIQSFKSEYVLCDSDYASLFSDCLQAIGPGIKYSWYDRRIGDRIGVFDAFAGQKSFDGLSVSQMTQGAALLSNYIR